MKTRVMPKEKNRVRMWVAASVLLVVALIIPQLTWAEHASDHSDGQFNSSSSLAAIQAHAAVVEKYMSGELVYNAPGRRDDRSFASASLAHAALVAKYMSGELVYNAPGRRDDRSFAAPASLAQIDAAFLAANPEVVLYQRFMAAQQGRAAAASSARWAALGAYYGDRGAAFLTANPEVAAFQRFVAAQQGRAAAASSARWAGLGAYYGDMGAAFLAANPEVAAFQRFVAAADMGVTFLTANPEVVTYRRYVAQNGCSDSALVC